MTPVCAIPHASPGITTSSLVLAHACMHRLANIKKRRFPNFPAVIVRPGLCKLSGLARTERSACGLLQPPQLCSRFAAHVCASVAYAPGQAPIYHMNLSQHFVHTFQLQLGTYHCRCLRGRRSRRWLRDPCTVRSNARNHWGTCRTANESDSCPVPLLPTIVCLGALD